MTGLTDAVLLKLYRDMLLVREFEQQLENDQKRGRVPGLLHTGVGQEATLAAIAHVLDPADAFFPDHRCHGLCLLAGSPGDRLMAEILGKAAGVCGGRGGSMHLADRSVGNFGGNVVEGSMLATALGPALAWQMRGERHISAVILGDGTVGRGEFNESLNLASVWKLPVLYCCINNQYAISTHVTAAHPSANMSDLAAGYQLPTAMVDGNDIVAAAEAARLAAAYVRAGRGPYFLEFHTWRWQGIFSGEMRSPDEVRLWKEDREPLRRARADLLLRGAASAAELDAIATEVRETVAGWARFAHESPLPDPATALDFVYADPEVLTL
ncbi:MAG: thiamine pyrophosphate-dependent dehydrogenase E1 component subunit alpha [Anaerolineales bacterium]|nr:thiamine pyrophosphate-dependent dehydrogenase E1 component subunit alpha [Anaerolineales bacterium]